MPDELDTRPLGRLALRMALTHPPSLGHHLRRAGLCGCDLATYLDCTAAQVATVRLCTWPRPGYWAGDIDAIAARAGVSHLLLERLLTDVRGLLSEI